MPDAKHAWTEQGAYEVAPGVHRIPLPLPMDGLRAVNVYAVEDGDGLVLIDSGWALDEARERLESSLDSIGFGLEQVHRFLVTHLHRDHYTMAITLRKLFGAKVALGIGEQPSLEKILSGRADGQLAELARWGAGSVADELREAYKNFDRSEATRGYEEPDEWLDGTTDIALRSRVLRAVPTPGHTNGHVVYVDAESSLLFAGDHVLPHITPSIGFEPARSELPLGDYLDSLRLMRSYPDMRLLPAHGPVAPSVHARVDELVAHHEDRLGATLDAVLSGAVTTHEAARKLGWTSRQRRFEDLGLFDRILATGETGAHLDVLVVRGELESSVVDGVVEYAPVRRAAAER
ncbi:MBL fold metallo-hydrolase [Umezawaea endophytica]|uniref:MBL fold metallo-hydrolase n=1 Tax=Umezawaea endophytica TaxID=1654476 RepID=A0A9X3AGW3_9PSEU|nr:MBL fold metallo-hydrolase [Umezawaea endophytica]MCS7480632.1 MBL fold metallo-hydrolase [Umezawaea endophytica]